MNDYLEMKKRHQDEVNAFPMAFAFSNKQFEEGMKKLGLDPSDTDKIYSIGAGGFIRRSDSERLDEIFKRHSEEMENAINNDITGEGFIFNMFNYELANHEYIVTDDVEDTLNAFGLTMEEVNSNPALKKGLRSACKKQREYVY
jgi:hypothetical protein